MPDKKAPTAFGLALFVCAGLSPACNGWRDPISGHRVCRAAPPAIASWSRPGMGRTPGDLADLKAWVTRTVPTLEDHLRSIKQIESQVARQ